MEEQQAAQQTASWTQNERKNSQTPSPERLSFLRPPPMAGGGEGGGGGGEENAEPNPILGWFEEIGKRLDKAKRDIFCCESGRHSNGMHVRSATRGPVQRAYGSLKEQPVPTGNIYLHSSSKQNTAANGQAFETIGENGLLVSMTH